jgi:hypothetical protein
MADGTRTSDGPRAIETFYNGYRFRSRLEARWAVFYDTLRIPYRYEMQGFVLPGGVPYLPDFWLPEQDCWIEIKGQEPTGVERQKAEALCRETKKNVYVFYGDCWYPDDLWPPEWAEPDGPAEQWDWFVYIEDGAVQGDVTWDNFHCWCECPTCGRLGIQFEGRGGRICRHDGYDDHSPAFGTPRMTTAYLAARQARFERRR